MVFYFNGTVRIKNNTFDILIIVLRTYFNNYHDRVILEYRALDDKHFVVSVRIYYAVCILQLKRHKLHKRGTHTLVTHVSDRITGYTKTDFVFTKEMRLTSREKKNTPRNKWLQPNTNLKDEINTSFCDWN